MAIVWQFAVEFARNVFGFKTIAGFLLKYAPWLTAALFAKQVTDKVSMSIGLLLAAGVVLAVVSLAAGVTWSRFSSVYLASEITHGGDNKYFMKVFSRGPGVAEVEVKLAEVKHEVRSRDEFAPVSSVNFPLPCEAANGDKSVKVSCGLPGSVVAFKLTHLKDVVTIELPAYFPSRHLPIIDWRTSEPRPARVRMVVRHGARDIGRWFTILPPSTPSNVCRCVADSPSAIKPAKRRLAMRIFHQLFGG